MCCHRVVSQNLSDNISALDNETEAATMDAVNSLYGKGTMIIIVYQLQTIEE